MNFKSIRTAHKKSDRSLYTLIIVNAVIAIMAIVQHENIFVLLWTYWLQSVIIGLFQIWRILTLSDFSTDGVSINGKPLNDVATPVKKIKFRVAFFFFLHYGGFHLGYMIFLMVIPFFSNDYFTDIIDLITSRRTILFNGLLFAAHYVYHYYLHNTEMQKKTNIGILMFEPYVRLIPVHIIIVLFFYLKLMVQVKGDLITGIPLVAFLFLKSGVDILMHIQERKKLTTGFPDTPEIEI